MPKLSATRTYANNQSPVQSDFDAFIDDIEILVNTIQFDDDNFQAGGIDASTKLVDQSIQANQIRNNNITTAKIADGAVTTSKIADGAVTTAKIADASVDESVTSILAGYLPPGAVEMFHTFNGTVDYPRGWMLCNGDIVNETNYDAIHGSGAYDADGVASSLLLNKNLPDMDDKYAIGVADTTKDGSSAITSVGNTDHLIDLSHTHETSHAHAVTAANDVDVDLGAQNTMRTIAPATTTTTDVTSGSMLQTDIDFQPESIQFVFIIRVV